LRLAEARGPRLSVNPARIEGGGPNNVVPELAILRVNFRPATLAEIEFDIDDWGSVAQGCGRLTRFIRPRDLDPTLGPDEG